MVGLMKSDLPPARPGELYWKSCAKLLNLDAAMRVFGLLRLSGNSVDQGNNAFMMEKRRFYLESVYDLKEINRRIVKLGEAVPTW